MHWSEYQSQVSGALRASNPGSPYALAHHLFVAWEKGRTVYVCGNGGSAANASHLAQDLSKGTIVGDAAPRLRCICLNDSVPSLTAWANDEGYIHALAEQLKTLGRSGDTLIAISGSGNSPNVLRAVSEAHDLEMRTWGITGFDGGKLVHLAHRCVHFNCDDMGMVEAAHGVLFHWLPHYLKAAFRTHQEQRLSILDAWLPQGRGL